MDDENRWDYPRNRGRGFDRQWDDEDRRNRTGRGDWDYEGPDYNRGSFNTGWEVDRDYDPGGPRDYGYGRDYSSGGDYGYRRDLGSSLGSDYGRSSINRSRGGFLNQLDRSLRKRYPQ